MNEKKTNEILEEQRRAREEFLKLKQMQKGEIAPEPKPSEVAYVPRTASEKLSNFWFHYKLWVIGVVITAVLLAVLIAQCATRVEYDLEILYFTYTPTIDIQTQKMADYFEKYASDVNGDGEVNVSVLNCSLSDNNKDIQYRNTILTKVQTVLAGNEKCLLVIADSKSIGFFDNIKIEGGVFENQPLTLSEEFYSASEVEGLNQLPKDMKMYLRRVSGTTIEKNKNIETYYKVSEKLLENLQ